MPIAIYKIKINKHISSNYQNAIFHSFRYYYPKHNRPDTPEGLQDNINRHFECLVAVIDDVVRSLPDISSHLAFLRRLGTMHADVEIQQRLLELMGPVFCNTVRPLLLVQGKWSFRVIMINFIETIKSVKCLN